MSETKPQVAPCDLPPSTLISYDDFSSFVPGMSRRYVERLAEAGRFVPGVRLMPRKPLVFRAGAVAAWLAERTAALDAPVVRVETTIAVVDETPKPLGSADLKALILGGKAGMEADQ